MAKNNNDQLYPASEAIKLAVEKDKAKFDSSVELHINFALDISKAEEQIRVTTVLPNGTGKKIKVAVFASKKIAGADIELSEDDLPKIASAKLKPGVDFDVIVSEPRYMAKLAQVAKILGPAGVMPNPKSGTVTENVEEVVAKLKKGQIELRTQQDSPIIHTIIGKKSFKNEQLVENFEEVMSVLRQNKPIKAKPVWIKSVFVSCSMGPSFGVELG